MTETIDKIPETPRERQNHPAPSVTVRRHVVAVVLAASALVAACVGAVGPAHKVHASYSWPGNALSAADPTRLWYTPLLLIRHEPVRLSVMLPCSLPPPLPRARTPTTVFATARAPSRVGGLAITQHDGEMKIAIGERVLMRIDHPERRPNCDYRFDLQAGRWSFAGGPVNERRTGRLESMPFVDGFFSALNLRAAEHPRVTLTTTVTGTRSTTRQKLAWLLATITACLALALVAIRPSGLHRRTSPSNLISVIRTHLRLVDAIVGLTLVGWWLIAPAAYDDGFILARETNFRFSHGFSDYYEWYGANHPLGYWLEWLQHWISEASTALIVDRLPALTMLAATWVLCRWILTRILPQGVAEQRVVSAAMASVFLAGALSWGMTLRPEPVTALLVTGVLASAVQFLLRPAPAPLGAALVLVAFAVTEHTAGIVAIAPLLVLGPRLVRWARRRLSVVVALFASAGAITIALAMVASDVQQRLADAHVVRQSGRHSATIVDELSRYAALGTAAPLQRMFVGLVLLAALGYLLRPRSHRQGLAHLPTGALVFSLVLLTLTPSKWPAHLGALLGVAAVAVAAETAQLGIDSVRRLTKLAIPLSIVSSAALIAAFGWARRGQWNALDLVATNWTPRFETNLSLGTIAGLSPLGLLAVLVLIAIAQGARQSLLRAPWHVAVWTAPLLAVPVTAFTLAIFFVDAVKADSWSLARQNVESLVQKEGCGLGDDVRVVDVHSLRPLSPVTPMAAEGLLTDASRSFISSPSAERWRFSPWLIHPRSRKTGMFVSSLDGMGSLELQWGRMSRGKILPIGSRIVRLHFYAEYRSGIAPWRFLNAHALPQVPKTADVIRVAVRRRSVVLPRPFSYRERPLADQFARDRAPTLVLANLLMYLPCTRLPRLEDGVVAVPTRIIAYVNSWPVGAGTTPFEGLLDLYALKHMTLSGHQNGLSDIAVYEIDGRIRGARIMTYKKSHT